MIAAPAGHAKGAVDFHTKIAGDFHDSYAADANRLERMAVWRAALSRHAPAHAPLAYDIGCGTGRLTGEIAPRADKVIAIDGAEGMLAVARRHLTELGWPQTEFRHAMLPIADVSDLPSAKLVISSSVIEYVPDLAGAVAMLGKLTAPGGVLLFSMSNRHSLNRAVVRLVHRLTGKPEYFGHVLHFTDPARLKALVEGAGPAAGRDGLFRRRGPDEPPVPSRLSAAPRHQHDPGGRPPPRLTRR